MQVDALLKGDEKVGIAIKREVRMALSAGLLDGKQARKPFHWPLEFPEVFARDNHGFDAILGNPPFLGNRLWKTMVHERMQWQAQMLLGVSPGKIDLCILFHRRAVDLLRDFGSYGLLATTNIAEGSAISVGLGEIVQKGEQIYGMKNFRWPGKASVTTSIVVFFKGAFAGRKVVDGVACSRIGSRLEPEENTGWKPEKSPNPLLSFAGVDNSRGLAFVVTPKDEWFSILADEKNSILRPYFSGEDITNHCLRNQERWALDIGDMELDYIAEQYPLAYRFLMDVVKETRTKQVLKSYKGLSERWWQFWNHRADLFRAVRKKSQCIVYSKITKHPICIIADTSWIYTNQVVIVEMASPEIHPICLSSFFTEWVVARQGAKFGVGASLRLSIKEAFDTFPLPHKKLSVSGVTAAAEFDRTLKSWCSENSIGVTGFANAMGNEKIQDDKMCRVREILNEIDMEVSRAYAWEEFPYKRDSHSAPYIVGNNNTAFILSNEARSKVLDFIMSLNREQFQAAKRRNVNADRR